VTAREDGELSNEVRGTLQGGILLAAALLLLGLAIDVAGGSANFLAPPSHISLGALPADLLHGTGPAFILLGVLVLVFTPIVRVLVSFVHFARRRDLPFTLITAFVLAVLAASVVIGVSP
jgi:uncharacterized membrane protein